MYFLLGVFTLVRLRVIQLYHTDKFMDQQLCETSRVWQYPEAGVWHTILGQVGVTIPCTVRHHPLLTNIVIFPSCDRWQQKILPRSFWHCQVKDAANTSYPAGARAQLLSILLWNTKFSWPGLSPGQAGQPRVVFSLDQSRSYILTI